MSETPRPPSQRQRRTEVNTGFDNGKPNIMGEIIQVQTKNGVIHMHKDVLTSTSDFLKTAVHPEWHTDNSIYDGTPKGSPARRLMVDFWAYSGNFTWGGPRNPARLRDTDFFEELLPCLYALRPKPHETMTRPWIGSLETYRHATVSERYKVKKGAGDGDEEDIDSADERDMAVDY